MWPGFFGRTLSADMAIKIIALAGSLRHGSFNRLLVENNIKHAPAGMEIEHFLLNGLPNFDQDQETDELAPAIVKELRENVRAADGVLLVTPEYNYSISSVLKSAIDWGSRPYGHAVWTNKPIAMQSASMGIFGGVRAQGHLRQVLAFFPAKQIYQPEIFIGGAHEKFDAEGNLTDEFAIGLIKKQLDALAQLV